METHPYNSKRGFVLVVLVLIAAVPFSLQYASQHGGFYLFSRRFVEDLPKRLTRPGRFRFILQPAVAIFLGIRAGISDARARRAPYILGVLFDCQGRRALLKGAFEQLAVLIAMSILLDALSQFLILHEVFPGPALIVGPVLIALPYPLTRACDQSNRGPRKLKVLLFAQSLAFPPTQKETGAEFWRGCDYDDSAHTTCARRGGLMNIKFAKFKKLMAALEGIGLIVVGTNAVRSALHGRSPAIADTRTGELVAFAAAPPQEASKPTPAAVVGGGQYSPNVGQTFPDSVYWGVAHVHTGYSFDTGMFGITDQKHQKKGRFATGRACQYGRLNSR